MSLLSDATMVIKGFSYSKLTELQVQGAQDRSRRQIELRQLATKLEASRRKWKSALQEDDETDYGMSPFREAIDKVYNEDPKREISPIMAARLAALCRQEFRCGKHVEAIEQADIQRQEAINYVREEIDRYRKEKIEIKEDSQKQIEVTKKEIVDIKRQKTEEMRENLQWKKQQLLEVREMIKSRIEDLEKPADWSKIQEPVLVQKCIDGTEWVDIDEDYFPSKGSSSGWVLCS